MTTQNQPVPTWILVVSALVVLLELTAVYMLVWSPQDTLQNVDVQARGFSFVLQMWAVRQFALAFIFAFAILRRSRPMLTLSYLFFLVMFAGDILVGWLQDDRMLMLGGAVMVLLASLMLRALNKKKKEINS